MENNISFALPYAYIEKNENLIARNINERCLDYIQGISIVKTWKIVDCVCHALGTKREKRCIKL